MKKHKHLLQILKKLLKKYAPQIFVMFGIITLALIAAHVSYIIPISASDPNPSKLAQKATAFCKNTNDWRKCYGDQLAKFNKDNSLTNTLGILKNIENLDPKTRDCHLIAHNIATSEVEKDPSKWLTIFDHVDQTTCTNGFVHGVLEGRSRFDSNFLINEQSIPEICGQIDQKTSLRVGKAKDGADDACAHIMGHILLAEENGEIKKAVETCAKVPSSIRQNCFDGIFMENITRENLESHEVAKKFALTKSASINLEKNCLQNYSGEAGLSCWRELAHIYTIITAHDPSQVYPLCYQTKNLGNAKECYMHSINLMILSEQFGLSQLVKTCKPYFTDQTNGNYCLTRALTPLLSSSVRFIDRAITLCETSPENFRPFCYSKIGQLIKPKTSTEDRKNLCITAPDKYFNLCTAQSN